MPQIPAAGTPLSLVLKPRENTTVLRSPIERFSSGPSSSCTWPSGESRRLGSGAPPLSRSQRTGRSPSRWGARARARPGRGNPCQRTTWGPDPSGPSPPRRSPPSKPGSSNSSFSSSSVFRTSDLRREFSDSGEGGSGKKRYEIILFVFLCFPLIFDDRMGGNRRNGAGIYRGSGKRFWMKTTALEHGFRFQEREMSGFVRMRDVDMNRYLIPTNGIALSREPGNWNNEFSFRHHVYEKKNSTSKRQ